jgi:hypothetical protein
MRNWVFTVLAGAVGYLYAVPATADEASSGNACVITIAVPSDESVYATLAMEKYGKVHMTCPVNVYEERQANIYILNGQEICNEVKLFGFPIIARKRLTDMAAKRSYDECSGVIQLKGRVSRPTIVYSWTSALLNASSRQNQMNSIFGRVAGGLISSGLPVRKFVSVNSVFCFEVDPTFGKDPLTAIRGIGVRLPTSIRQSRQLNKSCDDFLNRK